MVTVDRAEIQVEADLDEASFRRAAAEGNAILEAGVGDIDVDADFDGFLRGLTRVGDDGGRDLGDALQRSFTRQLVDGAGNIATTFTRALQGGIVSNPAIGIGLVTAIAGVMPLVGTLAAGLFVSAFGAGIAGLGLVFAAQNQQIRDAFSDLGSDLQSELQSIARPFEATLLQVVATIRQTFDALAPDLADSFATLAPAVSGFVRDLGAAFAQLGPALGPISDAFADILAGIGDRLPGLFANIAASLVNLSASIDPDQFAALTVGILQVIPAITNMIAALTRAQQVMQPFFDAIAAGAARVLPPLQQLFDAFGGASTAGALFGGLAVIVQVSSTIIAAALNLAVAQIRLVRTVISNVVTFAIGAWQRLAAGTTAAWAVVASTVSRVAAQIRGAVTAAWAAVTGATSRAWAQVRNAVTTGANAARSAVTAAWAAVQRSTSSAWNSVRATVSRVASGIRSTVSGAFNAAASATAAAWGRITSTVSRAVSTVISTVSRLRGAISAASAGLWNGLTAGLSSAVGTITRLVGSAASAVENLIGALGRLKSTKVDPGGGIPFVPGLATGTRNFAGGLAVVGERGPELLALPRGASVFTNQESRRIAAGAAGAPAAGGQTNHITLINNGPQAGAELLRDLTWSLKYAVGAGVRTI